MTRFKEIKKWMIDKSLTQAEIARKASVSQAAVHNFCKGYMSSANIKSVFLGLGCPRALLEREVA